MLALVNRVCDNGSVDAFFDVDEEVGAPPMDSWLRQPWIQQSRGIPQQQIGSVERALADFGQPPELLIQAVRIVIDDPANKKYLRERGKELARFAIPKIPGIRSAPKGPPTPPNPWVAGVVSPVLDPVTQGFADETKLILKPLILKATLAVLGVGVLGFIVGRVTKG